MATLRKALCLQCCKSVLYPLQVPAEQPLQSLLLALLELILEVRLPCQDNHLCKYAWLDVLIAQLHQMQNW